MNGINIYQAGIALPAAKPCAAPAIGWRFDSDRSMLAEARRRSMATHLDAVHVAPAGFAPAAVAAAARAPQRFPVPDPHRRGR
ncbi:hypothetical protein AAFP30_01185 [Gordonia sp. CPCC 205515]|uniref:hypothetical protein n=1 Tax=Gordonia sp. CPCC 205515 TaxID=3140791 RepID=UPI003AF3F5F5